MNPAGVPIRLLAATFLTIVLGTAVRTQSTPAVGIVEATRRPITETSEFLGRIEAVNRVNVVARVTAFLERRLFEEGAEIKTGDELYRLERGPFEADLASPSSSMTADIQFSSVVMRTAAPRSRANCPELPRGRSNPAGSADRRQQHSRASPERRRECAIAS